MLPSRKPSKEEKDVPKSRSNSSSDKSHTNSGDVLPALINPAFQFQFSIWGRQPNILNPTPIPNSLVGVGGTFDSDSKPTKDEPVKDERTRLMKK